MAADGTRLVRDGQMRFGTDQAFWISHTQSLGKLVCSFAVLALLSSQNLMARALYDNVPECAEELAFRKGDILTVIEQNTKGLEGWWLCSLHGRQGIVPGNRVKLLIGPVVQDSLSGRDTPSSGLMNRSFNHQKIYQVPSSHAVAQDPVYQVPPSHQNQGIYQIPTGHGLVGQDIYQVPPSMQRCADGPALTNKVITPVRSGQGYVYELPSKYQKDTYDIPPVRPLQGVYDIPPTSVKGPALPVHMGEAKALGVYDIPPARGVYATPQSVCQDDTGLRENLQDFSSSLGHSVRPEGAYDIPPPITKATGKELNRFSPESLLLPGGMPQTQSVYDIPMNHQNHFLGQQIAPEKDVYDTPRGIAFSGQQAGLSKSLIAEGREGVYDVPPAVLQDNRGLQDVTDGMNRLSFSSTGSTRSNMSTSSTTSKDSSFSASTAQDKRLILDPDTAIERLCCLQQMVETAVNNLTAFITPDWRSYGYMEKHINEIHTAVDKVEQSLWEYLQFAKGSAANASCLPEFSLLNKMRREVQRLEDSHQILTQTSHGLNRYNWSLNVLAVNRAQNNKCDDLDRFVMVARTVPDDAKQLTTTISVNAEVLFKQALGGSRFKNIPENVMNTPSCVYDNPPMRRHGEKAQNHGRPLPPRPSRGQHPSSTSSEGSEKSWMDDYDYVHLQGKEEFERQQKELLEKENIIKQSKMELEHHQLSQFQRLEQEITKLVENDTSKWKPPQALQSTNSTATSQDSRLLLFYSSQCETHFNSLLSATAAFFSCVNSSQPPQIFVAHSKFIIFSAHKLVFIGDTLARQMTTQDICNKVMNSSNQLCELLKSVVLATKGAALSYPSTAALQKMVDRVTELSHQAQLFKLSLVQMVSL
ncbi:LOW QUALITY PROTEIN: enhancer of filamentation 1 [Myiozetetes cayanensis]|uniref:LOW QUALITY PROTEIN: enhancer of filamentation 1 n=1 Tax=Myiozetetes cayanensis TaxID=478635 RepID=UPI00215E80C1|nr:LOW QUALITY PROTEIN: enhancer of filamentation 1 [Myiozetetes cayanensis]